MNYTINDTGELDGFLKTSWIPNSLLTQNKLQVNQIYLFFNVLIGF